MAGLEIHLERLTQGDVLIVTAAHREDSANGDVHPAAFRCGFDRDDDIRVTVCRDFELDATTLVVIGVGERGKTERGEEGEAVHVNHSAVRPHRDQWQL